MTSEELRALASLAATAPSVRVALASWPSAGRSPVIGRVARRARLGAPLSVVVEPLCSVPEGELVARAIAAHGSHGGSLAATMRALADAAEARELMSHDARMAGSASKLSTRLLLALALAGAILVPAWQRSSLEVTASSLGVATVLAGAGSAWMRKLVPRPPRTDPPAATFAEITAALLEGGLLLARALEVSCPSDLPARRLVRLGMTWSEALSRAADPAHRALAEVVRASSGAHAAGRLRAFAADLREEQRRRCEAETRRAPVLLVLPLATCFLPAFGLVIAVPMLQGLSGSG